MEIIKRDNNLINFKDSSLFIGDYTFDERYEKYTQKDIYIKKSLYINSETEFVNNVKIGDPGGNKYLQVYNAIYLDLENDQMNSSNKAFKIRGGSDKRNLVQINGETELVNNDVIVGTITIFGKNNQQSIKMQARKFSKAGQDDMDVLLLKCDQLRMIDGFSVEAVKINGVVDSVFWYFNQLNNFGSEKNEKGEIIKLYTDYSKNYPNHAGYLAPQMRMKKNPKEGHPPIFWWSGLVHATPGAQYGANLPPDPSAHQIFFQTI